MVTLQCRFYGSFMTAVVQFLPIFVVYFISALMCMNNMSGRPHPHRRKLWYRQRLDLILWLRSQQKDDRGGHLCRLWKEGGTNDESSLPP